nr:septal ring lytic transglycosylase RlpA family protein [Rhizobium sp. L43]
MNPAVLTAAHRSLAFGTKVKVTNRNNGRTVVVRINDRGPFIRGRVLDLSRAAAQNIGMVSSGTAKVAIR